MLTPYQFINQPTSLVNLRGGPPKVASENGRACFEGTPFSVGVNGNQQQANHFEGPLLKGVP